MSKSNYYSKNKSLSLFKSYHKSKFRSLKHDNYFHVYEDLFKKYKNKKIVFIEIGVANGGSLFMWRSFFGKNARIIGIDLNPAAKRWKKYGFEIFIGNQADPNFWKFFFAKVKKADIIVDDGGHTNDQMINTFNFCYKNINDEGLFLFEDTHTSYLKEFGNPSNYSFINFCFSIVHKVNLNFFKKNFKNNYQKFIYKIEFYQSLVVFYVDKNKTYQSRSIDNYGTILNAEDYRLRDKKIFNFIEKIKIILKLYLPNKIYKILKKLYPYIKYFVFKIFQKKNKSLFY
jgi:23S rRNA U2552 (ribose-2'-O)-methylase RlmE/FtsJ